MHLSDCLEYVDECPERIYWSWAVKNKIYDTVSVIRSRRNERVRKLKRNITGCTALLLIPVIVLLTGCGNNA